MSHSRKDGRGGHARREIVYKDGHVTWNESTKAWAKRFKHKQARRHNRMSIRDLAVLEPDFTPLDELLTPFGHSYAGYEEEDDYDPFGDDHFHDDDWGWEDNDPPYQVDSDYDRDYDDRFDIWDDFDSESRYRQARTNYGSYSICAVCGSRHYDGES